MTHAEIRTTIAWALREMDRADQRLDQSETESIPSVAKMLKEDSSVAISQRCPHPQGRRQPTRLN
jgi:uncharacterized tellurite resistance protein B-like protein